MILREGGRRVGLDVTGGSSWTCKEEDEEEDGCVFGLSIHGLSLGVRGVVY